MTVPSPRFGQVTGQNDARPQGRAMEPRGRWVTRARAYPRARMSPPDAGFELDHVLVGHERRRAAVAGLLIGRVRAEAVRVAGGRRGLHAGDAQGQARVWIVLLVQTLDRAARHGERIG